MMFDDKRLIPHEGPGGLFTVIRRSLKGWRYCKYCYRDTPQFLFTEEWSHHPAGSQTLRCCWECGSGLELVMRSSGRSEEASA